MTHHQMKCPVAPQRSIAASNGDDIKTASRAAIVKSVLL
jgi:hypothetical protein